VITVTTASGSNVVQGLTLNGVLSGSGFVKTGSGSLVLGNAGNTFTGNININQGVVSIDNDSQLGNAANLVLLNPQTGTATLRATESFTLTHAIQLSNTSNIRAIEVISGKTLQLDTAFDLDAGAGATANLLETDLGTLVLNSANAGWSGILEVGGGALQFLNVEWPGRWQCGGGRRSGGRRSAHGWADHRASDQHQQQHLVECGVWRLRALGVNWTIFPARIPGLVQSRLPQTLRLEPAPAPPLT